MSVKSGQAVAVDFTTADPTTGAAADADALPTAKLVVNGTDNAATVTVTNKATGVYKAAVTLPTLTAGDVVSIRVAATVATVAGVGVVWTDVAEAPVALAADQPFYAPTTWRDLEGLATASALAEVDTAVDAILVDTGTTIPASIAALPTDDDVQAAAQAAIVAEGVSTFNAATDPVEVGGVSVDAQVDVRTALGMVAADLDNQLSTLATPADVKVTVESVEFVVSPEYLTPLATLVKRTLDEMLAVSTDTITIKQDDTLPYLGFNFTDIDGNPLDCTDYVVKFLVRNRQKVVVLEAEVGAVDSGAVWLNQSLGLGEYRWVDGDTAETGTFEYEFEFTRISDSRVFTVPKDSYYTFTIIPDIG